MPKVSKTKVVYRLRPYVSWEERLEELKQYNDEHGNCNVPDKYDPNPQLGWWVRRQRQVYKKNKLSKECIESLQGIGFEWVLGRGRVSWDVRFEQLKGYKKDHGDCDVPQVYKANPQLGSWVRDQRVAYKKNKLSKECIESLQGIGFEWVLGLGRVSWDERFEQLKGYKKDHGDCNVPRNYKANPQLGKWVNNQRTAYKKGKLSSEQIKRMQDIGFVWVLPRGRKPAVVEISDAEDSTSGGEEEAEGATSAGDTQNMIPSLPPLPSVADDDTLGVDNNGGEDTNGESMLTDEYQGHKQGDVGEVELANDGSSFHMDEEDDRQEDDREENDDIDSPTNVSPAVEQEGGRSSSVESQQDLKQKLYESNARIDSLLQPDIVDLTNEDSTICEDNQKESAGTKSVEAAVYAVYKVKQEKLDEADKKIAAAEEKVAVAEKRAELAEKRASVAEEEKSGHCKICLQVKEDKHAIVACGHSLCFDCYWELKKLRCPFCNVPIEPVKKKLKRLY